MPLIRPCGAPSPKGEGKEMSQAVCPVLITRLRYAYHHHPACDDGSTACDGWDVCQCHPPRRLERRTDAAALEKFYRFPPYGISIPVDVRLRGQGDRPPSRDQPSRKATRPPRRLIRATTRPGPGGHFSRKLTLISRLATFCCVVGVVHDGMCHRRVEPSRNEPALRNRRVRVAKLTAHRLWPRPIPSWPRPTTRHRTRPWSRTKPFPTECGLPTRRRSCFPMGVNEVAGPVFIEHAMKPSNIKFFERCASIPSSRKTKSIGSSKSKKFVTCSLRPWWATDF